MTDAEHAAVLKAALATFDRFGHHGIDLHDADDRAAIERAIELLEDSAADFESMQSLITDLVPDDE